MQDNSTPGVVNWQWTAEGASPMTSTSENPTFFFPEGVMGTYTVELIVETAEGCVDTVERELIVNSDILFYAPNSFTPDGDEFNQTWTFSIQGVDEYNFELLIFNRWGEIIWETHDINSAWDGTYLGKIVPAGTYTWVARVKDIYSDEKREFNGYINVLK
jgi:gliding motility-associated-like protein